ncbi:protease pro-enzyme activation domain-containing protein [Acerihabitans sp. KWT182]|uniref:Protease pro-enzyme activation domain-containing protein n=1 Tax=Acerihabitans sp. KWT182 TaxID=3157919 RepID=A0AAU7QCR1_9GAMM
MTDSKYPLPGSDKPEPAGFSCIGPLEDNERFDVSLIVRRPDAAGFQQHLRRFCQARDQTGISNRPTPLSREEYARRFCASPDDMKIVRKFAHRHQLRVVKEDPVTRTMTLSGTARQFNDAFGVSLQHYQHASGHFRGRSGAIHLPVELADIVTAVLGLDNRPQARAHFRFRPPIRPAERAPDADAYTPLQLAALYDFAPGNGSGQCVGIIELGGGYDDSDLKTYFTSLGLMPPPR